MESSAYNYKIKNFIILFNLKVRKLKCSNRFFKFSHFFTIFPFNFWTFLSHFSVFYIIFTNLFLCNWLFSKFFIITLFSSNIYIWSILLKKFSKSIFLTQIWVLFDKSNIKFTNIFTSKPKRKSWRRLEKCLFIAFVQLKLIYIYLSQLLMILVGKTFYRQVINFHWNFANIKRIKIYENGVQMTAIAFTVHKHSLPFWIASLIIEN